MAQRTAKEFQPVFADCTPLKVLVPGADGAAQSPSPHLHVEDTGPSAGADVTFLCLPGLGDVRQQYRFLGPLLRSQGHRVLVSDLRGHGDSSADFSSYTPLDISSDIRAILSNTRLAGQAGNESLRPGSPTAASLAGQAGNDILRPGSPTAARLAGQAGNDTCQPVVLLANSLSAASAIHFAASHPNEVAALVLSGPVARDLPQDDAKRPWTYVLFWPLWGPSVWVSFFDTMFKKTRPGDLKEYEDALRAKLGEGGRLTALAQMARGRRTPCFEAAPRVQCPVLLIYGDKDPDFGSPEQEAAEVKVALSAAPAVEVHMVSGVGHYPHVEEPEECLGVISSFLKTLKQK